MGRIRYLLILILATFFYGVFAHFYKITLPNSIFFISVLWMLPLSIRFGKDILDREIGTLKNELLEMKENHFRTFKKLENVKQEKVYLEKKLTDLSKLYTITKEMSSDIRFGELFDSLKNFLEDNFQFEKFKIILFRYENGRRSIDRVYEISAKSKGYIEPDRALRDLADSIAESRKPLYIKNLLAIPLIARRKVISVILVEDSAKDDQDRFLILVPQVALEIERIRLFDDVERLSIMDGLTGTFLRRHFLERLKEEVKRAEESRVKLAFIMADLDYFKKCNDNFGHLAGDVVLKEIADILKKNVREIDLIARFGGEEFCILLPETDTSGAYLVAERIREAVARYNIKAYDEIIKITISMGISSFPEDSQNIDELIENADKALYEAKRKGRNRTVIYS